MDFFYRQNPWYAGQFVRKVIPKIDISLTTVPFFTAALNKLKPVLLSVLVRNVDNTFLNSELTLPVTDDGAIDFNFMENFMAELETTRIGKLEKYLSENGLNNYKLNELETDALEDFSNIEWAEFKLGALFEKISTKKLPYRADELSKEKTGKHILPCLTSSFKNQGLNYFAPEDGATVLRNVISIPSNSDIYRAYFQSNEFTVLSDAYAVRWILDDIKITPNQYLFAVQSINKVTDLSIYSYKNKLGGWNVVKNKLIKLPVKNMKPDYEIMDILISAIKKLIIKDVVMYVNQKMKTIKK